jgi:hypothetical protein
MVETTDFTLSPAPHAWPLIFRYLGPVLGNGFVALVELHGRILARPEDGDEMSIEGVNPGGFAVGTHPIRSAKLELQRTLTGILIDIAQDAESFETFQKDIEAFFWETDAQSEGEWEACVKEVRSGRLSFPLGILPVFAAESPLLVTVRKIEDTVTPSDNPAPEPVIAAVA